MLIGLVTILIVLVMLCHCFLLHFGWFVIDCLYGGCGLLVGVFLLGTLLFVVCGFVLVLLWFADWLWFVWFTRLVLWLLVVCLFGLTAVDCCLRCVYFPMLVSYWLRLLFDKLLLFDCCLNLCGLFAVLVVVLVLLAWVVVPWFCLVGWCCLVCVCFLFVWFCWLVVWFGSGVVLL